MKVRSFLQLLILALIAIVPVQASTTTTGFVHQAWHEYKDTFTVEGVVYDVALSQTNFDLLRFRADQFTVLLTKGDCVQNDIYTYCFANESFESDKRTISPAGGLMPGIYITISKNSISNLDIKPTYTNSIDLATNQQVSFVLTNNGQMSMDELTLELSPQNGIQVKNAMDFSQVGEKYVYVGFLASGGQRSPTIEYAPTASGTYYFNYSARFTIGGVTQTKNGSFSVKVLEPADVNIALVPSSSEILTPSELTINVSNRAVNKQDLKIQSLEVSIPSSLNYISASGLTSTSVNLYTDKDRTIFAGRDKIYTLKVNPLYLGTHNISIKLTYVIFGTTYTKSLSKNLVIQIKGLSANFYFDKAQMMPGNKVKLYYTLKNENPDLWFYGLNLHISGGDFLEETATRADIEPAAENIKMLEKVFQAPLVENDTTYRINATLSYKTESGQTQSLNSTFSISVIGSGKITKITQTVTPKTVKPGDEIVVEVKVKNLLDEVISDLAVSDFFDPSLQKIIGNPINKLNLIPNEEKSAYVYKLRVPETYRETSFNITTSLSAESLDYLNIASTKITVTNTTGSVNGTKPGSTGTNTTLPKKNQTATGNNATNTGNTGNTGTTDASQELSFFKKIFMSIENFFNTLFGSKS